MPPYIATLVFAIGIAGLFYLNRDDSARPSKALWLPVIWLSIIGSRPVSAWLGMGMLYEVPGQLPPTSLLDQLIATTLMSLGAIVLIRRHRNVMGLLKASWPILLYFSFALFSLLWSDFPAWGFKRWVRALGDIIMVLIVVTDAQPTAALRRLFSRVGFVLLPASVLLVKYYPSLGRAYDPWGLQTNNGVATSKNMLGVLAFFLALGALWQVLGLLQDREQPNRARRLLAQGTLLAFGVQLLFTAQSATSAACFVVGTGLMLALALPPIRRRPLAVHSLVLAVLLGALTLSLGDQADTARAMGRDPSLSGRTKIWDVLIPMVPSSIGGAGFETFWVGPRVRTIDIKVGGIGSVHESHNGYIEVYLNLGWLGLGLIALILVQGYRRAVGTFHHDPGLGALLAAYIVTVLAYNCTEAGFRILSVSWFFLLLTIVTAMRVISLGESPSGLGPGTRRPDSGSSRVTYLALKPTWTDSSRPSFRHTVNRQFDRKKEADPRQRWMSLRNNFFLSPWDYRDKRRASV